MLTHAAPAALLADTAHAPMLADADPATLLAATALPSMFTALATRANVGGAARFDARCRRGSNARRAPPSLHTGHRGCGNRRSWHVVASCSGSSGASGGTA